MLKRKAYESLLSWKKKNERIPKALLIEGARRVGKSTLVEEFAKHEYDSYLLIDFSIAEDAVKDAFMQLGRDLDQLWLFLQTVYNVRLYPHKSLVIFDEIQSFPKARELVKHLVNDGRYDIIETGSLISIKKHVQNIVIPSGERRLRLNPMDFEEFLWAQGQDLLANMLRTSFIERRELPQALHTQAMLYWRQYLLLGGMPEVIQTFIETESFEDAEEQKQEILSIYQDDMVKFTNGDAGKVANFFQALPSELTKHDKRFVLAHADVKARTSTYQSALFWISDAQIADLCYNATDPSVALAMSQDFTSFKAYMADTGLLISHAINLNIPHMDRIYADIMLDKLDINEGMLVENAVAQALRANGHDLYFYARPKTEDHKALEVDFLITQSFDQAAGKQRISPIEVKSGSGRYATASLDVLAAKFKSRIGYEYVIHKKPFKQEGNRLYLPFYLTFCL